MKKKLLVSFAAMLAIVGLVFAEGEWTAAGFWTLHGTNLAKNEASITADPSYDANEYLAIKASCEAYLALGEDDQDAVAELTDVDPTVPTNLTSKVNKLYKANEKLAAAKVKAITDKKDAYDATKAKASDIASVLSALKTEVKSWDDVIAFEKAEEYEGTKVCETLATKQASYLAAIADAWNYAYADKFVEDVKDIQKTENSSKWNNVDEVNALLKSLEDGETFKKDLESYATAIAQENVQLAKAQLESQLKGLMVQKYISAFNTYGLAMIANNGTYEALVDDDLDFVASDDNLESVASTDYQKLAVVNYAWSKIVEEEQEANSLINAAVKTMKDGMLASYATLADAVEFINTPANLYTDACNSSLSYPETKEGNKYAEVMTLKGKLAATTDVIAEVKKLYTDAKVDNLWKAAQKAFIAYDLAVMKQEALDAYNTTYARVLAADFKNTAADYYAGTSDEVKTVRDAINAYKALDNADWKFADYYRNGNTDVKSEQWPVDNADIASDVKTNLSATYSKLQKLVNDAAVIELSTIMRKKANAIYNTAKTPFVVAEGETFTADQALTLKNSLQSLTDAQKQYGYIGTASYKEDGVATTNFTYYMWDTTKDEYVVYYDLKGVQKNYPAVSDYKTECWGYSAVVAPFKASAKANGLFEAEYYNQNADFTALKAAATFLKNNANLIWKGTGDDEVLNTTGEGITSAVKTQAETVTHEAKDYEATQGSGKYSYLPGSWIALSAAAKVYVAPVKDLLYANCNIAINDNKTYDADSKTVMVYAGTSAGDDKSDVKSWKDICALVNAKDADGNIIPNTLVYVNDVIAGDLPTNIIVRNADNTGWRATEIELDCWNGNFYVEADVEAETITLHKSFGSSNTPSSIETVLSPWYVPFDITVGELKDNLGENCIARMMNAIYEEQDKDDPETVELRMNFNKKTKDTDVLYAWMPYTVEANIAFGDNAYKITVSNKTLKATQWNMNTKVTPAVRTTIKEGSIASTTAGGKITATLSGVSQAVGVKGTATTDYHVVRVSNWDKANNEKSAWQPYGIDNEKKYVEQEVKAGRIMLKIAKKNVNYIRYKFVDIEDDATAIENVETENKQVDGIYTINGVKVDNMDKPGLYIVNGKKIMVK